MVHDVIANQSLISRGSLQPARSEPPQGCTTRCQLEVVSRMRKGRSAGHPIPRSAFTSIGGECELSGDVRCPGAEKCLHLSEKEKGGRAGSKGSGCNRNNFRLRRSVSGLLVNVATFVSSLPRGTRRSFTSRGRPQIPRARFQIPPAPRCGRFQPDRSRWSTGWSPWSIRQVPVTNARRIESMSDLIPATFPSICSTDFSSLVIRASMPLSTFASSRRGQATLWDAGIPFLHSCPSTRSLIPACERRKTASFAGMTAFKHVTEEQAPPFFRSGPSL